VRELVFGSIKALVERAKSAEETYKGIRAVGDPVEKSREDRLRKITEVRNDSLSIPDLGLQQKIWCLLMEQTIGVYEAVSESDLKFVDMGTEQVDLFLKRYKRDLAYRSQVSLFAVAISLASLIGIGAFLYWAYKSNLNGNLNLPILGIPSCVLLWSVIGSFAAILYRFSNSGDRALEDPLRWLFARPIMGVIMGAMAFLVLKAGFITISQAGGNSINPVATSISNEVTWLIAFLAGFSDRFSEGLLKTLAGRFGDEKTGDLVSMQLSNAPTSSGVLDGLSEFLKKIKLGSQKPKEPAPAAALSIALHSSAEVKAEES
jgi:hypothetical protein